jgi:hypothetical protein
VAVLSSPMTAKLTNWAAHVVGQVRAGVGAQVGDAAPFGEQ